MQTLLLAIESYDPHKNIFDAYYHFLLQRELINELKNDKNFFDYKIFNKKKLILRLQNWKNSKRDNSVFPWQTLMIYTFIKKNFN